MAPRSCHVFVVVAAATFVEGVHDCDEYDTTAQKHGANILQHRLGFVGVFSNVSATTPERIQNLTHGIMGSHFASLASISTAFTGVLGGMAPERISPKPTAAVLQMLSASLVCCALVMPCLLCAWICCLSPPPKPSIEKSTKSVDFLTTKWPPTSHASVPLLPEAASEFHQDCGVEHQMGVHDAHELQQLLIDDGIDVSAWGPSLEELRTQIMTRNCQLNRNEDGHLIRHVNLLTVHVIAEFPGGMHVLKCVRQVHHNRGTSRAMRRSLSRKLRFEDDADETLPTLLQAELEVLPEWHREHLELVWRTTTRHDTRTGEFGQEFVGLTSNYDADELWLKVVNVANDSARKLLLPSGEGTLAVRESTGVRDMTRSWQWVLANEEDLPPVLSQVSAPLNSSRS